MKKAKKLLSLVLVLVLALGMVPFASAAVEDYSDFTDADSINDEYVEGVDILVRLGVLAGYPDGSFDPDKQVLREEAAKIMCYLAIGTTAANNLKPAICRFTDVEDNSWASGYIEYCADKGIIKGLGDNTFGYGAYVTGAEMSAMLLRLIGWGAKEEYMGNQWEVNAVVDGQNRNILINDVDYSAGATREEVAYYAFNAMTKTSLVTYNPQLDRYYEEGTQQIAGTNTTFRTLGERTFDLYFVTDVDNWGYLVREWKIQTKSNVASVSATYTYRIDRTLAPGTKGWTHTAGFSPATPNINSLSQQKTGAALTSLLEADGKTVIRGTEYWYNGQELYVIEESRTISNTTLYRYAFNLTAGLYDINGVPDWSTWETSYAEAFADLSAFVQAAASRKGCIVDLIDTPYDVFNTRFDGKTDKVVIIEKTASMITSKPVVNTSTGAVTLYGTINEFAFNSYFNTATYAAWQIDYDTDITQGDYVLYVMDGWGITHVEKADFITGQLTNYQSYTRTATITGDAYTATGLEINGITNSIAGVNPAWAFDTFVNVPTNYDRDLTAYLDDNGTVFALALGNITRPSYIVVLQAEVYGVNVQIRGILEDGTVVTPIVAAVTTADGIYDSLSAADIADVRNYIANTAIFEYTKVGETYFLTQPQFNRTGNASTSPVYPANSVMAWVTNKNTYNVRSGYVEVEDTNLTNVTTNPNFLTYAAGIPTNTSDLRSATNQLGTNFYGDDDTIFVHRNLVTGAVKVYTGIRNIPTFQTGSMPDVYAVTYTPWPSGSTTAKVVYLEGGTAATTTNMLMFTYLDTHNGTPYTGYYGLYVVADVVDATGTVTQVKVDKALFDGKLYYMYGPNSQYSSKLVNVTYTGDVITDVSPVVDAYLSPTRASFAYGKLRDAWGGNNAFQLYTGYVGGTMPTAYTVTASTPVIVLFDGGKADRIVTTTYGEIGGLGQNDDALFFVTMAPFSNGEKATAIYIVYKTNPLWQTLNAIALSDTTLDVIGGDNALTDLNDIDVLYYLSYYLNPGADDWDDVLGDLLAAGDDGYVGTFKTTWYNAAGTAVVPAPIDASGNWTNSATATTYNLVVTYEVTRGAYTYTAYTMPAITVNVAGVSTAAIQTAFGVTANNASAGASVPMTDAQTRTFIETAGVIRLTYSDGTTKDFTGAAITANFTYVWTATDGGILTGGFPATDAKKYALTFTHIGSGVATAATPDITITIN